MDKQDVCKEEFAALRREIDATKSRLFKTVCLGLVVVPVLTYVAELPNIQFVGPLLPFVILVLTILFVSEEHALMRAGRYVRERIEPLIEEGAGWEAWLESKPELRLMDKYLFGCFLITFFAFYFGSVGVAITKLWASGDVAMNANYKALAGAILYGVGAFWMILTVVHHWRGCTTTATD